MSGSVACFASCGLSSFVGCHGRACDSKAAPTILSILGKRFVIAPLFQIFVSRIGGKQATLAEYHDSVWLIVKASACGGLTPRWAGAESVCEREEVDVTVREKRSINGTPVVQLPSVGHPRDADRN